MTFQQRKGVVTCVQRFISYVRTLSTLRYSISGWPDIQNGSYVKHWRKNIHSSNRWMLLCGVTAVVGFAFYVGILIGW